MTSHLLGHASRWRWLSFVFLLAMLVAAVPSASAQTNKGPAPTPGGPTSGPNQGPKRTTPAIGFRGETPAQTQSRVLQGKPKLHLTRSGTDVEHADPKPVMLMLFRQDKDQRGVIRLPSHFKNGFAVMHVGRVLGPVTPLYSTELRLNVPTLLDVAAKLNMKTVSFTFVSFAANRLHLITVNLHFEHDAGIIRLEF